MAAGHETEHIVFGAEALLQRSTLADLPDAQPSLQLYSGLAIYFGKASPSPFVFAIHDEDTLEFIHSLQLNASEGMRRLFSELRHQNLLLIGCNFADWLSRFFIRLSNVQRLADSRGKREFLIEESMNSNDSLTLFLERFSPNTWVFRGSARDFVADLARRWKKEHPYSVRAVDTMSEPIRSVPRPDSSMFVSYSRADIDAARRLVAGWQEIGAEIVWFDQS